MNTTQTQQTTAREPLLAAPASANQPARSAQPSELQRIFERLAQPASR
jgi:hypothetical protein